MRRSVALQRTTPTGPHVPLAAAWLAAGMAMVTGCGSEDCEPQSCDSAFRVSLESQAFSFGTLELEVRRDGELTSCSVELTASDPAGNCADLSVMVEEVLECADVGYGSSSCRPSGAFLQTIVVPGVSSQVELTQTIDGRDSFSEAFQPSYRADAANACSDTCQVASETRSSVSLD